MLDKYKKIFIAGTDTNVGKTYYSVKLLKELRAKGFSTIGVKPISTGYDIKSKINDDAKNLHEASSIKISINEVNPFSFKDPISPNIAAKKENVSLNVEKIIQELNKLDKYNADIQIIEGVGGWDAPINSNENMSDLAKKLDIPVILVVSIKLGCLNHAILTSRAIMNDNVKVIGWIANCISKDTLEINENINTLKSKLKFKLLDIIT